MADENSPTGDAAADVIYKKLLAEGVKPDVAKTMALKAARKQSSSDNNATARAMFTSK